jgi:bisphosphoglycerate-independent phosphoglycerate mutase (AlkP superfamily)
LWIRRPTDATTLDGGESSGEPAPALIECDLLDIAPTVLALGGVQPPPVMDGHPLF